MTLSEILTEDYTPMRAGSIKVFPIIRIEMTIGRKTIPLRALLDTGSDGGVSLTVNEAVALDIDRSSPIDPTPKIAQLANNSEVEELEYSIDVKFQGLTKPIPTTLSIMGLTPTFTPMTERERKEAVSKVVALLGRDVMDKYIVTFNGKANPQKKFTFAE